MKYSDIEQSCNHNGEGMMIDLLQNLADMKPAERGDHNAPISRVEEEAQKNFANEYITLAAYHQPKSNSWIETCTKAGNNEIDRRLNSGEARLAHGYSRERVHQENRAMCVSEYQHLSKSGDHTSRQSHPNEGRNNNNNNNTNNNNNDDEWRREQRIRKEQEKNHPLPATPGGWPAGTCPYPKCRD
jgi:hypothetical protein